MDAEILDYINSQRIGVLAVEMLDGSPHAATVHFANINKPLMFFFETDRDYRKSQPLFGRVDSRASLVIGFDESNAKTLQLDGSVRLINNSEKDLFQKTYLTKFPEKQKKAAESNAVFFVFIPKWWRFTDWTKPEGKIILTSEDNA